jgi:AcrR family transcriptional regulator
MGITERKEREKVEKRLLILEAAKQIFIEEGFEKASIRAISDRIEYSPATIYLYFKDKNELLFAIHELGFEKLLGEMSSAIDGIEDPIEQLRKRGYAYMKFAFENPEMYDLMFIQNAPIDTLKNHEVWNCGEQNFMLLCETIQSCIDANLIRIKDLNVAAMSIWSFMHGLVSLRIRNRFNKFNGDVDVHELMIQTLETMIAIVKV